MQPTDRWREIIQPDCFTYQRTSILVTKLAKIATTRIFDLCTTFYSDPNETKSRFTYEIPNTNILKPFITLPGIFSTSANAYTFTGVLLIIFFRPIHQREDYLIRRKQYTIEKQEASLSILIKTSCSRPLSDKWLLDYDICANTGFACIDQTPITIPQPEITHMPIVLQQREPLYTPSLETGTFDYILFFIPIEHRYTETIGVLLRRPHRTSRSSFVGRRLTHNCNVNNACLIHKGLTWQQSQGYVYTFFQELRSYISLIFISIMPY